MDNNKNFNHEIPVFHTTNFCDCDMIYDTVLIPKEQIIRNPPINIIDEPTQYILEAIIPGIEENNIKVHTENDIIVIIGEIKNLKEINYTKKEFSCSNFIRKLYIPRDVDIDSITAYFEKGILKIFLPKIIDYNFSKKKINIY